MYDARNVANRLIQRSIVDENELTPLQIIKLTYFCHGWSLAFYDEPLIYQNVEAWENGPVVYDVYRALKYSGREPVGELIRGVKPQQLSPKAIDMIDFVYNHYGQMSGAQLWNWTHEPGTPWHDVWNDDVQKQWVEQSIPTYIKDDLIADYFRGFVDKVKSEQASDDE